MLGALRRDPPDLLVTDLVMPGCPGMTLIWACREDAQLNNLKILLLTPHGDRRLARFLQYLGNIHYLSKPVAPQEFSEGVDAFLQGSLEVDLGSLMVAAHHPEDMTGLGSQAEHVNALFKPLFSEDLVAKLHELLRARDGA